MQPHWETVSRSERKFRDTLSATGLSRKLRPTLSAHSGTHFPKRASQGNCIPFRGRGALSAEHAADALPCQISLQRRQGRLRITATDLIDTLKFIRLATE